MSRTATAVNLISLRFLSLCMCTLVTFVLVAQHDRAHKPAGTMTAFRLLDTKPHKEVRVTASRGL